MKNDKAAMPKSKNQVATGNNAKKSKGKVTDSDTTSTATGRTKARAGRGLANEGTIVSYDEER